MLGARWRDCCSTGKNALILSCKGELYFEGENQSNTSRLAALEITDYEPKESGKENYSEL